MAHYTFDCGCSFPILGPSPNKSKIPLLDIRIESVSLDCPAVWDLLSNGRTVGVFQLEKPLGQDWSKRLKPESIDHLSALGALLRPGCLMSRDERGVSMTENYCRRKNNEEVVESLHPSLDDILNSTYSVMVYQEEIMQVGAKIAGFDLVGVDALRKCVSGATRFVSRTRGWVTIDTLMATGYEGEEFLIMDELGRQQWRKLDKIWSTGMHAVRNVKSWSGFQVAATKHHQFLTDAGWKARSRLCEGDSLVAARHIDFDGVDEISVDKAMVMTGLITEGYFVCGKRGTFTAFNSQMMETFCSAYERCFGSRPKLDAKGRVAYIPIAICRQLGQVLRFGKSESKRFPDALMGATKESMRQFLSFALAAEGGCEANRDGFSFSSKSFAFIMQVKLLLLRFGVQSLLREGFVKGYPEPYYRLLINDHFSQLKMYEELTVNWPDEKRHILRNMVIKDHRVGRYSSDSIPARLVCKMLDQYPSAGNYEGGSIYKEAVTRSRFTRVAANTNDSYWTQLAAGHQYYDSFVGAEDGSNSIETYDFTVAGGDAPYIIADGLVIHNCVGKKDAKALAAIKAKFLDGCKNTGLLPDDKAMVVWSWIEAAGRYSFNLAHAAAYALITYFSAYAKAHLPVYFFTSWLRGTNLTGGNIREDIAILLEDATTHFSIHAKRPDLLDLEPNFYTDGESVQFGLGNIKAIGERAVSKVLDVIDVAVQQLRKPLRDFSWFELFSFVLTRLSAQVSCNLMRSGACDHWGIPRVRMIDQHNAWNALTNTEKQWLLDALDLRVSGSNVFQVQSRIDDLLERKLNLAADSAELAEVKADLTIYRRHLRILQAGPSTESFAECLQSLADLNCKDTRRDEVLGLLQVFLESTRVDSPRSLVMDEEELLGAAVSLHRLDQVDLSEANCTVAEFLAGKSGHLLLGVEVVSVKHMVTKKGKNPGSKMAQVILRDKTGTIRSVCFPGAYSQCGHNLIPNSFLLVQAERDKKDHQQMFVVNAWYPVASASV